jgi:hypothetical protein
MFSVSRLPKCFRCRMSLAEGIVPLVVLASLLAEPGSSLAGRRTRRSSGKPQASAPVPEKSAAKSARPTKAGAYNPADETVEMFEAMDAGQIAVKMIPKNSTEGRLFIKNKTGKPLNVRLPEAFAAMPVLAQMGAGGQGMGGGGGGGGGMGGGGMFNVPAEKEGNLKVPCVCLEHGKPEPTPRMTYTIKPIQSFTTKPGVSEMLKELGHAKIDQRAAQVAAWHLNNDMSWEQLANKKTTYSDGSSSPYFSAEELRTGMQIADQALRASEAAPKDKATKPSPGETAAKQR